MARKFKVELALSDPDLEVFNRLCLRRSMTLDGLNAWLRGRGYRIHRTSAWNYRRMLERELADERREALRTREVLRSFGAKRGQVSRDALAAVMRRVETALRAVKAGLRMLQV